MADSTLANLTAATAATGGLFYGTQSSADKKFTLTAAGATLIEAADAAAQVAALNAVTSGGALGTPSSGTLTNCTSIPAGQLTGSVATARLGSGTADATTYLRGDATWATVSGVSGTKTIVQFTPRDNQPPATNFATLDTRNSIAVLDFDTATEEAAIFVGVIPEGAVLTSGLTVRITWSAATATSGDCRWGAQWMRLNTDIDSDSFDTATEVTTTTNGTSGIPSVTSITCTTIDGVTVGDAFRLKIYRDTGDAADTMAGDAELITVEARTAN